jgi:hypothetical protein
MKNIFKHDDGSTVNGNVEYLDQLHKYQCYTVPRTIDLVNQLFFSEAVSQLNVSSAVQSGYCSSETCMIVCSYPGRGIALLAVGFAIESN